jgi:hypothetical protein
MSTKTVEERLLELEKEFADIKRLRRIVGPRGPAGDIDAAVINATEAAEKIVIAATKTAMYPFDSEVDKLRQEFEALRAHLIEFTSNVENSVALHAVALLKEYHLLDSDSVPFAGPYAKKS